MDEMNGRGWRPTLTALFQSTSSERWHRALTCLTALLLLIAGIQTPTARADAPGTPPRMVRPVPGELVTPFDAPRERWSAGHRGADLRAAVGTTVVSAAEGIVAYVGTVAGTPVVSIDHWQGGSVHRTTYEPVTALVRQGERVDAGDAIGTISSAGHCPGGCLHWGLRLGHDTYLDPMDWLSSGTIRLLPSDARAQRRPEVLPGGDPRLTAGLLGVEEPRSPSSRLVRPTPGPVTSRFGPRLHPIFRTWRMHDGIDLGDACGTPVVSSAAARVISVEHSIGYGLRVVLDHGQVGGHRVRTTYNHLSSTSVARGQLVAQGQQIARVGSTGWSTGCHLHYMVVADGTPVDPLGWL